MATRYHPGVIWGPFLLALALGLIVSAGLYFAYLWPHVEPDDVEATPATGESPSLAAEAPADEKSGKDETNAAGEAKAPASESSPA